MISSTDDSKRYDFIALISKMIKTTGLRNMQTEKTREQIYRENTTKDKQCGNTLPAETFLMAIQYSMFFLTVVGQTRNESFCCPNPHVEAIL